MIRFWGCRGSFPCSEESKRLYGGDTSCIEIRTPNNDTIILDMGTGLKRLGQKIVNDSSYKKEIHIFLSHFHLDHIHGFVMFAPLFDADYTIKNDLTKNFSNLVKNFIKSKELKKFIS